METKIKELSKAITTTDLHILLEEIKDLKRNLSIELQAVRDDRLAQYREFKEFIAHLIETLDQIKAKHLIEAQLLDLIGSNYAGDQKTQKEKRRRPARAQAQTSRIPSYRH